MKFLAIVAEVSKSPTFQIESPRARAALECAKYMQFLLESTDGELKVLSTFCDQLYASLEKLCTNVQTSRFSFSTQRIKLMTLFHQKRTTDLLEMWKELWSDLTKISDQSGINKCPLLEPVFIQHCCSAVLESLVKEVFPAEAGYQPESILTGDQQCALRYVAGYMLRNIKEKIKSKRIKIKHQDEALCALNDLSSEDAAGTTDDTFLSYSRRWINLVNRGGLYVVSDEVYTAFQAMELAFQEYLRRGTVGKYNRDAAVEYITNDGDVQFFWCCVMSTISEECAQELLQLLVELLVTIRGFSLAAAYMEEYKMSKQEHTKGKKGLRRELKRSEATTDKEAEHDD